MVNKISSLEALKNLIDLIDEVSLSTLTRGQKRDVEKNRNIIEKDLKALDIIKEHCQIDSNGVFKNINTVELSWDDYDLVKQVLNNNSKKSLL